MATKSSSGTNGTKNSGQTSANNAQNKGNVGTKKDKNLKELLEDNLKDAYSAEVQLLEALPEMAEAAQNKELQNAFAKHYEETSKHVSRLTKILDRFEIDPKEIETCKAMQGLIAEGKKIMEDYKESPVRDSALIIGAQKIEHYEIAAYGSLCELADVLGYSNLHDLLGRTLDEEESTDEALTEISETVNDDAKLMLDKELATEDSEQENASSGKVFR